jgi:anti-anti-sigma regulatory factor
MPTEALLLRIEDEDGVAEVIDRAAAGLDTANGDLVLELSAVSRIDAGGLRALENLLRVAAEKAVKVSLSGVNGGVYKVLKLMKLTPRFSFVE